jgi:hypothetical protein
MVSSLVVLQECLCPDSRLDAFAFSTDWIRHYHCGAHRASTGTNSWFSDLLRVDETAKQFTTGQIVASFVCQEADESVTLAQRARTAVFVADFFYVAACFASYVSAAVENFGLY